MGFVGLLMNKLYPIKCCRVLCQVRCLKNQVRIVFNLDMG